MPDNSWTKSMNGLEASLSASPEIGEGIYKIWGQFKYKGEVIIVPFAITVK